MEATIPTWRVRSASVAGSSHIASGLECQDANMVRVLPDGTLVVAVCDGAGSAKRAAEGSELAARCSVEYIGEHLADGAPSEAGVWQPLLTACLEDVRRAVADLAAAQASPGSAEDLSEFATTILLAVVTKGWLATVQIGDGAIVSRDSSGALSVLTVQGDSEYINETSFITSSDYMERAHFHVASSASVTGLAALTDGMQMLALKYADNTAHVPFFTTMFDFSAQSDSADSDLEAFLRSDRVCERTDDDKTLVFAVRE